MDIATMDMLTTINQGMSKKWDIEDVSFPIFKTINSGNLKNDFISNLIT